MAFVTKAVKAAAVPAVVEVSTHVDVVSGAPRIYALKCVGTLVLVPVSDPLTWTPLGISV